MKVVVPHAVLPTEMQGRADLLDRYFCELLASAQETANGWSISLMRPCGADYYIDPELSTGLRWWSASHRLTGITDIPFSFSRRRGFQISLQDAWTLLAWSEWLQTGSGTVPPVLTLLHVDDHDDFMPPRLLAAHGGWHDAITGETFDLHQPVRVMSAIRSGAVGIGSFMAPLLHYCPEVHVRHLCATEYASQRKGPHQVHPVFAQDAVLAPGTPRPALEVHPDYALTLEGTRGHPYLVTDDLKLWLHDLPAGPVLLHIDMDYFNNRFNGDSDWRSVEARHDPALTEILERVDQLFNALDESKVSGRIVDCAVALSPGFFPAEFWEPAVERLETNVRHLTATERWIRTPQIHGHS